MDYSDAMDERRYGLYPGTFDPVHLAHLALARQAIETLDLALVVFLPAGQPVNKPDQRLARADDRAAMIAAAIRGNPGLYLSRLELDRPGPSYLVDSLELIAAAGLGPIPPAARLVVLGGIDIARTFPAWRAPQRILALAELAYFERTGEDPGDADERTRAALGGSQDRLIRLAEVGLDVRSSNIRARTLAGMTTAGMMPDSVEAYIRAHRLYGAGSAR
jgi:nicotinate-nucleotide adenylyltransferase